MMDDWVPLSARTSEEGAKVHDQLHEGIPSHLVETLKYWLLTEYLELPAGQPSTSEQDDEYRGQVFVREFEAKSAHTVPRGRPWTRATLAVLFDGPVRNGALLLDMLDFAANAGVGDYKRLKTLLDWGRSAWTVDV